MLPILLAFLFGFSIFLMAYGYDLRKKADAIDPLAAVRTVEGTPSEVPVKPGGRQKLLDRLKAGCTEIARDNPWLPQPFNLEQRLAWAGKLGKVTDEQFKGEQILYALVMAILGLLLGLYMKNTPMAVVLLFALGAVGYYLPIYQLDADGRKRQKVIMRTLPDAIELVAASVTAGLTVDRSVGYAAENVTGPLGEELTTFLQEMSLGTARADAYQRLTWRNNAEDMQIIVGAMMQGQSLGVPVAETLDSQVEMMRERRLQRAKEEGAKASPRITLITTIFVVPSVFLMFLAVVVYNLYVTSGEFLSTVLGG